MPSYADMNDEPTYIRSASLFREVLEIIAMLGGFFPGDVFCTLFEIYALLPLVLKLNPKTYAASWATQEVDCQCKTEHKYQRVFNCKREFLLMYNAILPCKIMQV